MSAAARPGAPEPAALLEVDHLQLHFPVRAASWGRRRGFVHAVDDVTFRLAAGETLGLVGESGCGKTSLARCVVRLNRPTGGRVLFTGTDVTAASARQLQPFRQQVQMVFQDPQASLNPRQRVGQAVAAGVRLRQRAGQGDGPGVAELLRQVGLSPEHLNRYPHELAGGQRQRVGVARALAAGPRLIVLDEPVSALDVSVQAQVINLLDDLQDGLGLSYLFVAHDLSVVRHVADRIAVMYLGQVVELSPAAALYTRPLHPYTASLLDAVPVPDPARRRRRARSLGEPPNPVAPPSGCRFHPRCPFSTEICRTVEPPLTEYADGRLAACHHPRNVTAVQISGARRSAASPRSAGLDLPSLLPDAETPASRPGRVGPTPL